MRNYSPEAIESKANYCHASDVYMFGLIIYEMAHGKVVWDNMDSKKANEHVFKGGIPEFRAKAPHELVQICLACLNIEPASRPTFKDVSEELMRIYRKYMH